MDISVIINDRIKSSGKSQAEIAEHIETTPSQLGLFLKGEASLSRKSLNKLFEILEIDLMMYKRRNDLAKRIASTLKAKQIDKVMNLTREDIIALTGESQLSLFPMVSDQEFESLCESGLVDPESTYNYMKDLIEYYLTSPSIDKITNRLAQTTVAKMETARGISAIQGVGKKALAATALANTGPVGWFAAGLFAVVKTVDKRSKD